MPKRAATRKAAPKKAVKAAPAKAAPKKSAAVKRQSLTIKPGTGEVVLNTPRGKKIVKISELS